MARINHQALIEDLNLVFNLLEDLADEENKRLALYIETMGYDENEPVIIKSEAKIKDLREKAEKVQRAIEAIMEDDDAER